jgi:uncharacterized protein (DUF2141 family)
MIRFACLVLLLVNGHVLAQTDSLTALRSRSAILTPSEYKALPVTTDEPTYSITITVRKIRNRDGVIRFKFYNDDSPFPHDDGFLKVVVPKSEMTGDSLAVTLPGFTSKHMAIALLDDENDNVKLDFGWFLPKEGYAFSNYYHSALRRPVYADFAFTLTGDKHVVMTMRYY